MKIGGQDVSIFPILIIFQSCRLLLSLRHDIPVRTMPSRRRQPLCHGGRSRICSDSVPARIYPTAVLLLSFQNVRLKTPSPGLAAFLFSGSLKRKKPHGGPLMQPFIFNCHRRRNVFSSPFFLESGPPRRRQAETEKPPAYRASVRSVPRTNSPIKMRKTRFVKRHP